MPGRTRRILRRVTLQEIAEVRRMLRYYASEKSRALSQSISPG